jgi:hypothetical protein
MNPRVEIERQRLRDELAKSKSKTQKFVVTKGGYDNATGLTQVNAQNGGTSFALNLSNLAQEGDPMRLTKALGQLPAIDSLQAPRKIVDQKDLTFWDKSFAALDGDRLGDPTIPIPRDKCKKPEDVDFSALRGDVFGGFRIYRKRNEAPEVSSLNYSSIAECE